MTTLYAIESIPIPVPGTEEVLHLERFCGNANGPVAFLLHGSIENGKIFYSRSGKGFAPWLAKQGYDVFVADRRGHGQSKPSVSKASTYGQREELEVDLDLFLKQVNASRPDEKIHCIAHSWGGVQLLAYLGRHTNDAIRSLTFFGSKRHISIGGLKKWVMVNFFWTFLAGVSKRTIGYMNARMLKMGSDNESVAQHNETDRWVKEKGWHDPYDGFDYAQALQEKDLPPILSMTGIADDVLGHPIDCQELLRESGYSDQLVIVGKKYGNKQDYDHINLLTHPDALEDHFPRVLEFLQEVVVKESQLI